VVGVLVDLTRSLALAGEDRVAVAARGVAQFVAAGDRIGGQADVARVQRLAGAGGGRDFAVAPAVEQAAVVGGDDEARVFLAPLQAHVRGQAGGTRAACV